MAKIQVLHLIKSLGRGGAEMLLPETLKLHRKDGFEFHYIYFLPWKDQMVGALKDAGGRVTCLSARNNFQMLARYKQVIKYCEEYKIELIHCHLPWSGFLGRLIFKKTDIPLIYTEHNIQERYHILTKKLNKATFKYQTLALGVSKDVTDSINRNISPKIPVKTVLNGVNTEQFQRNPEAGARIRQKFGIPLDAFVIGKIAVFREQKALPDWVKAFKEVSDKHNNAYGIIVGAGPTQETVKELIKELGLSNKIFLPGLQTNTVAYFSAMDIFMMSSAFEGLPVALLEAMSMRCAVVSTRAGGVREAVRDKVDGLLCEPGDHQCLAKNVKSLLKNEQELRRLQVNARERVRAAFSLSSMVEQLEDIYSKTLDSAN